MIRWNAPILSSEKEMSYDYALEILDDVRATKPFRDSVDNRVIDDFRDGIGETIINVDFPDDYPTYQNLPAPIDSDLDGMPGYWELIQNLSPQTDDSAFDQDNDGYTNIEEYLHYLSGIENTVPIECISDIEITPCDGCISIYELTQSLIKWNLGQITI